MNFLIALMLGLAYAAPPCPVNLETIRRGLHGGIGPALSVQFGSLAGDVCYMLLVSVGSAALLPAWVTGRCTGLIGALMLLILGTISLRDGMQGRRIHDQPRIVAQRPMQRSLPRGVAAGAVLSLANPDALCFWLTAGVPLVARVQDGASLAGFFAGVLVWAVTLPLLTHAGRRLVSGQRLRDASVYSGAVLAGCGLVMLAANAGAL